MKKATGWNAIALYEGYAESQPLTWLFFIHPEKSWKTEDELMRHFGACLVKWAKAIYEESTSDRDAAKDLLRQIQRMELHEFMGLWPKDDMSDPGGNYLPEVMEGWEIVGGGDVLAKLVNGGTNRVVVPFSEDTEDPADRLFEVLGLEK